MLELVTPITNNKYSVGDKLIPKEISTSDCDLPCDNEYTGKEGTIVNEKNFYFSHWLKPQTEYNAF